ncbi:hypothetical protein SETIT_5G267800v2 [Setaria italica]|uniref:Uncharacterized protein n=1 Tax=Setaria italica TaxID=4555 RepID=A0A368R922_SETIT|nr:hypothetical protein SETIT_5G267800v2 [Setaria italica]
MVWPPFHFAVAVVSLLSLVMPGGWSMRNSAMYAFSLRRIEAGRRHPLAASPGELKEPVDLDAIRVRFWRCGERYLGFGDLLKEALHGYGVCTSRVLCNLCTFGYLLLEKIDQGTRKGVGYRA